MFNDSDTLLNDTYVSDNPLAVLKPTKEPRLYTLAEFLDREERSQELHEYYDGIIIKLPMARSPHNIIGANMITALNMAFMAMDKNYLVSGLQQLVYSPKLNYGLYPDVLVIAEKPQFWDDNEVLLLNPIAIIEVLSKSTKKYDRTDKFTEYKTISSFREYVLIDQNKSHVETRFREEPNLWRDTIVTEMTDSIYLKSLACAISLKHIYRNIEFPKPRNKRLKYWDTKV